MSATPRRRSRRTVLTCTALAVAAGTAFGVTAGSATAVPNTVGTLGALHGPDDPYRYLPKVPSFTLTSKTVRNNRPLPTPQLSGVFGAPGGRDVSPQLSWSGFPARTRSFVVSMYDPQAGTGSGYWHWVIADLPARVTSLPENAGALGATLPAGALQLGGDTGTSRYIGGAPPKGSGKHHYHLTVTALDVDRAGIDATTSGALLGAKISAHAIARATIVCPTAAS